MTIDSQAQPSLSIDSGPGVPSDRALAAWEIASLVSSALIAEWILSAAAGRTRLIVAIPLGFAFLLVITSHFLRRENLHDLGFRFDNFLRAAKLLTLPMIVVAVVCVGVGLILGTRPDLLRWHRTALLSGNWHWASHGALCSSTSSRVSSTVARRLFGRKVCAASC